MYVLIGWKLIYKSIRHAQFELKRKLNFYIGNVESENKIMLIEMMKMRLSERESGEICKFILEIDMCECKTGERM